jgi:hypothetical protein
MWANEFRNVGKEKAGGEAKQRRQSICSIPGVKREHIFELKKGTSFQFQMKKKIRGPCTKILL